VDVGGDNNVVDVNVVITQNGGSVAMGGDDSINGGGVDDYLYEFVDDDAGSMSVSMSMRDDDFIDDNQYGDKVTTAPEEMEKPEAVTEIANDDTGTEEEDGNADVIEQEEG
jgi:hypothetical protein